MGASMGEEVGFTLGGSSKGMSCSDAAVVVVKVVAERPYVSI